MSSVLQWEGCICSGRKDLPGGDYPWSLEVWECRGSDEVTWWLRGTATPYDEKASRSEGCLSKLSQHVCPIFGLISHLCELQTPKAATAVSSSTSLTLAGVGCERAGGGGVGGRSRESLTWCLSGRESIWVLVVFPIAVTKYITEATQERGSSWLRAGASHVGEGRGSQKKESPWNRVAHSPSRSSHHHQPHLDNSS